MIEHYAAVLRELGVEDGFLFDWRIAGTCQHVSPYRVRKFLSCPAREAVYQCEVIGPHEQHRWTRHTVVHARHGNGYPCLAFTRGERSR